MAVYEIPGDKYNMKLAEALKNLPEFKMPEWAVFVKTSILRQIYINKVVGVGRLRTRYGGKQNRGMRPSKFRKSSGKIIRVILQQAEREGLLEQAKSKKKGRQLTKKGIEFLESIK